MPEPLSHEGLVSEYAKALTQVQPSSGSTLSFAVVPFATVNPETVTKISYHLDQLLTASLQAFLTLLSASEAVVEESAMMDMRKSGFVIERLLYSFVPNPPASVQYWGHMPSLRWGQRLLTSDDLAIGVSGTIHFVGTHFGIRGDDVSPYRPYPTTPAGTVVRMLVQAKGKLLQLQRDASTISVKFSNIDIDILGYSTNLPHNSPGPKGSGGGPDRPGFGFGRRTDH